MTSLAAVVGGGMVGSAIARRLRAAGEDVVVLKGIAPGDRLRFEPGTRRVFVTAQSRESHSAIATVDLSFVNTTLVERVLAAAREAGVERVCLFSTASVYRAKAGPFQETDALDEAPRPYVASKIAAEALVRERADGFRQALIVRPVMIYGPGLGASRLFARLPVMVRNGQEISLAQGKGLLSNPIHSEDAARAAIALMSLEGLLIFNIGGPDVVDLGEVVQIMSAEMNLSPMIRVTDGACQSVVADIDKMIEAGAGPSIAVRGGLRTYFRSLMEQ